VEQVVAMSLLGDDPIYEEIGVGAVAVRSKTLF